VSEDARGTAKRCADGAHSAQSRHRLASLRCTEDLEQLEETIDVLSDREAVTDIRDTDAAVARSDVVRGMDAVRALRPRRR
jgi:hypothetical protein